MNVDYFDDFRDTPLNDKRFVRVSAKNFAQTGAYITIELYTKDEEGTFKYRQGITLSTGEWRAIIQKSKD